MLKLDCQMNVKSYFRPVVQEAVRRSLWLSLSILCFGYD